MRASLVQEAGAIGRGCLLVWILWTRRLAIDKLRKYTKLSIYSDEFVNLVQVGGDPLACGGILFIGTFIFIF